MAPRALCFCRKDVEVTPSERGRPKYDGSPTDRAPLKWLLYLHEDIARSFARAIDPEHYRGMDPEIFSISFAGRRVRFSPANPYTIHLEIDECLVTVYWDEDVDDFPDAFYEKKILCQRTMAKVCYIWADDAPQIVKRSWDAAIKRFTFLVKNNLIVLYGRFNSFRSSIEEIEPDLWSVEPDNHNIDFDRGILTLHSGETIFSIHCETMPKQAKSSDVVNTYENSMPKYNESIVERLAIKLKEFYPIEKPILQTKVLRESLEQKLHLPPGTIKPRTFERALAKAWPKTNRAAKNRQIPPVGN